jgi:alcohol oxidase
MEGKKAVGIEYQTNPKFMANPEFLNTGYASPRTVRARKLVVLSAGANGTPLILERSGIGNPEILKRAGVDVIEAIEGVGHDYQDHHLSLWSYRTSLAPRECINGIILFILQRRICC